MNRILSLIFVFTIIFTNAQVDCNLSYLTTIENFDVYTHNPSGAILFRAKMVIDADGSPRAYGPNNSGLDWTANAGYPGNWWGIVTDANGTPVLQGSNDPYPGMYISPTSLVRSGYSNTNTLRYVDSENIPYIALPSSLQSLANISKGDLAYVRNITNGQSSFAYFADSGPGGKLGEGSMALAAALGINNSPKNGGTSQPIVDYVVFPQSGYGQGTHLTVAQIDSIANHYLTLAGGVGLPDCIDNYSPQLNCDNTIPLTCGVIYSGVASTNPSVIETYGCNSWSESGPERVHSIVASGNGTLTATVSNYSGDLDVYILGSCDPMDCIGTVGSTSATFNNAVAGATYYIVIDADDGSGSAYNLVVNCPASSSTEDLTLINASIGNSSVNAGANLVVNVSQVYSGSQTASSLPDFEVGYYLSTDCNLSSNDTLIGVDITNVGSDITTSSVSSTINIPANVTAGNYYVLFVADNAQDLLEQNENNNIVCLPIVITPLVLDCYNAIALTCGITYHGASSNAVSHVDSYGCNSWTEAGPERVHVITPAVSGVLTATVSNYSGDLDVYILGSCDPSDCLGTVSSSSSTYGNVIAGQSYYVIVDADDGSGSAYDLLVSCASTVITDDITVADIVVSETILMAGQTTLVSVEQVYGGNQQASALPYFDLVYALSTDCNLDSSDIVLGRDSSQIGSNNPMSTESATLMIPIGTVTGIYYILFSSDHENELVEVDETNNVGCQLIEVVTDANVSNFDWNELKIFPNPTNGMLFLSAESLEIVAVEIYNEIGVLQKVRLSNSNQLDFSTSANGLYFIKVKLKTGDAKIFKVVKN